MKKLIALIIILLVGAAANNAWQATGKKRFASTLKESAVNTKDVVLERYCSYGTVLQSARISNETFKSWIDQLPIGSGRLPHTISKCWIPHHRIKFDATRENNVEICFTCNEIWTKATGRRKIPEDWRQPLRAMFVACNISDVAPDWEEGSRFLDAMEAEQGGADQLTTAPELKSEGKDKPQPESKVAPR